MKKDTSKTEYVEKPKSSNILRIRSTPNTIIFEPYAMYTIPTILKDALKYLKDSGYERGLVVHLNGVIVPIRADMTTKEVIAVWRNERNGKSSLFARKPQSVKTCDNVNAKEPGE